MLEKKQKFERHLLYLLVIIVLFLITTLISTVLLDNNKKEVKEPVTKDKINPEQEQIKKYKYLVDRLYYGLNAGCDSTIYNYVYLDKMKDETKILVALNNIKEKNIEIKPGDEIDMTGCKTEKMDNETVIVSSRGIILSMKESSSYFIFSAVDVENKLKEIFGKDTIVKHQSIGDAFYDKTAHAYIFPGHECGNYGYGFLQKITKVTTDNNYIYAFATIGSYANVTEKDKGIICIDYDYNKETTACIKISALNKKYLKEDNGLYGGVDTDKYFEDNINKFSKYKYTFEIEDNNYVFKKLEKID